MMSQTTSLAKIRQKQKELNNTAFKRNNNLTDSIVYKKSCELDKMIVNYMRNNKQMEIIFN